MVDNNQRHIGPGNGPDILLLNRRYGIRDQHTNRPTIHPSLLQRDEQPRRNHGHDRHDNNDDA